MGVGGVKRLGESSLVYVSEGRFLWNLCQLDVKPTRNKRYLYTKPVKMEKTGIHNIYVKSKDQTPEP